MFTLLLMWVGGLLKALVMKDPPKAIRSETTNTGLFRPINIYTMTFSLKRIKQLTSSLGVTLELEHLTRIKNSTQNVAGGKEGGEIHHQVQDFPSVLSFNNLTYSVKTRQKTSIPTCFHYNSTLPVVTKVLLNDISGEAREGEILAVLGPSGSGKSTLIDALANRIAEESLKGSVTLNGKALESSLLKSISAYVMQDDLLFPMLTVEETLMFSAEFRLPRSLSKSKKKARVEALIDQLDLTSSAQTVIGDEGHRGVSGGERHRVSIGVEIVHDPMILFLDEPTTGLDSTSAFMVIEVLQRIARSGSVVIMSIHQPSYRILGLLDRLMFLSQGETVYSGPPSDLPHFFSAFNHPIPIDENWSEFTLDLIHDLEEESSEGTKSLIEFNKSWQESRNHNPSCSEKDNIYHQGVSQAVKAVHNSVCSLQFANPFWIETMLLVKRSIRNERRMPAVHGIRLLAVIFTAFMLATLFWNLDNSPRGVQERLGFFNFTIATILFTCIDAIPFYLQERNIFIREIAHNAYRRSSYVIAHSIIAIPLILIYSISFSLITFWAVGLSGGFFFYFLMILVSFWAGSSFVALVSGVLTQQIVVAYLVGAATICYFIIFCGFYLTRDRIPSYWIWFHYISLAKYPYQGGLMNEFDDPSKCFVSGVQMFDNTPLKTISTEAKIDFLKSLSSGDYGMNITPTTCVTNGVGILKQQAVTDLRKWDCFWIMIAWGVLFRILFYVCLLVGRKNKRK